MRRIAANIVYINNDKEFHKNHIVELFDDMVVNHYNISEELAMTEWLGGMLLLTTASDVDLTQSDSIEEFYEAANACEQHDMRMHAYHLNKVLSPTAKFSADNGGGNCHIKRL